ncbi:hypothetical protein [Janthinobacterium psychrotolerans]|uniref:Uncharacterized protein n=1 Tax=Janthinobacterium psychrotolerans TaxID=1747903 RepID=A0A1A7CA58_9BURK|nr:hypothetical protein [Janthinobacterium psychrotolerans]OBV41650.1 hypothetical protein ASR47_104010 [Janthinobacterium psychrotolerans]
MAKTKNKNWALIESMGYTIQRTLGGNFPAQRYEAVPLSDSIAWQIGSASGWAASRPLDHLGPSRGSDLSKWALRRVSRAKAIGFGKLDASQWLAGKHCSACADCHGFLCLACALAIITPELARECNGEPAWAAARKGGALDTAMSEMIAATPALRAERERLTLAALVPTAPTACRLGGRL